jgi:polysaccharide export outer membrane protein
MLLDRLLHHRLGLTALLLILAAGSGCRTVGYRNRLLDAHLPEGVPSDHGVPRELAKISLPIYRIEPPDILLIDAVKVVPKAPYEIEALDLLQIIVEGTLPAQPIAGIFSVEAQGTVSLGPSYGVVQVVDLTLAEARLAIEEHLERILTAPEVSVTLAEPAAKQQIAGEHLVAPDGTVTLGIYGAVYITGMTLAEAKLEVERHLSQFLEDPEVSIDIFSYNSKTFYVITQGAGNGDIVTQLPVTGNDTVLSAISQVGGLTQVSSRRLWVARPAPDGVGKHQVLPVNWRDITANGSPKTNYQLMPGDRLFIAQDPIIAIDSFLAKVIAPMERVFGFSLLSAQTIQIANRFPDGSFSNNFNNQNSFF